MPAMMTMMILSPFYLYRAIAESIALQSGNPADSISVPLPEYTARQEHIDNSCPSPLDEQLRLALVLSQQEEQDLEQRRKQEEDELEMILKLSLTDK